MVVEAAWVRGFFFLGRGGGCCGENKVLMKTYHFILFSLALIKYLCTITE